MPEGMIFEPFWSEIGYRLQLTILVRKSEGRYIYGFTEISMDISRNQLENGYYL